MISNGELGAFLGLSETIIITKKYLINTEGPTYYEKLSLETSNINGSLINNYDFNFPNVI